MPGDKSQPNGRWRDAPLIAGFGSRTLCQVLTDVLIWRSRTAAAESGEAMFRGVTTFRLGIPVPAADLHAFAAGTLDDEILDLYLRACLALSWRNVRYEWPAATPDVPVTTLGLLHSLAGGIRPGGGNNDEPGLALSPGWAVRLAAGQVRAVHDEAAARLRQVGWDAVPSPPEERAGNGVRIAAALVARCLRPDSVLSRIAIRMKSPDSGELS
jgi:CRISPR-associated protein Csx17